jgi:Ca2+-binding RTX toxin-like protein
MRRLILLLTMMAATLVVASGVALALAVVRVGTNGTDVLLGTQRPDKLLAKGGNDTVLGRGGDDEELSGGKGNDRILGGAGKDIMDGGAPPTKTSPPPRERSANNSDIMLGDGAADLIDGNLGPDRIVGGDGNDALFDGESRRGSRDVLVGGNGNDILFSGNKPARQDIAECGPGRDTDYADRTDVLSNCERVLFRPPTEEELRKIGEKFFGGP